MEVAASHLVVDISGHGYGHLGQIRPVLRALVERMPSIVMTIRTSIPSETLERILGFSCSREPPAAEAIPMMFDPNSVDADATARAFTSFHADFATVVTREAERLAALRPTLLVSDVPYSSLAAAQRAGIPAVAFSSLNWFDIVAAYCGHDPALAPVLKDMERAYLAARLFIQCSPHLPMAWHPGRISVGPTAEIGQDCRPELLTRLGARPSDRIVLVSYGGIAGGFPVDKLPYFPNVRWVFGDRSMGCREDGTNYADLPFRFADIVRSCDLVITKPGYGLFTECACNGTPILYAERPDWPETPFLAEWIERNGVAAAVAADRLLDGDIADDILRILERPRHAPVEPTGIDQSAAIIADLIAAS